MGLKSIRRANLSEGGRVMSKRSELLTKEVGTQGMAVLKFVG